MILGKALDIHVLNTKGWWPPRRLREKKSAKGSPLLSVLHQNKASHNFHKRGLLLIDGEIKGLD